MAPRVPRPFILAHRGFAMRERENTLAAFDAAVSAGAQGIEFDVRQTKDDALVVHHDDAIRIGRGRPRLASLSRSELPPWVPTLDDVCIWAKEHVESFLDVEIKEPGTERDVARIIQSGGLASRSVFTSFHPDVAYQLRERDPTLVAGFITEEAVGSVIEVAASCGAALLVLKAKNATPPLVADAKARGLHVWSWGTNTIPQATRQASVGVEALITDRPDRLRSLGSPGARPGPPQRGRGTRRRGN